MHLTHYCQHKYQREQVLMMEPNVLVDMTLILAAMEERICMADSAALYGGCHDAYVNNP